MRITHDWLEEHQACASAIDTFDKRWPEGVELSPEALQEALELGLNLRWLAFFILSETTLAKYNKQMSLLVAEYDKQIVLLWTKYSKRTALLWAEYSKRIDPPWAEYSKRIALLRAQCNEQDKLLQAECHKQVCQQETLLLITLLWSEDRSEP